MITVNRKQVSDILRMEYLARLSAVQDKIRHFEQKYNCSFHEFEAKVQGEAEDFEWWDDYMEWKAYRNVEADIQHNIFELQHGNFEIIG